MKLAVRALAAATLALLPLPLVAQDGSNPNTYDRTGRPLTAVDQQGRRYSYTYEPDGTQNRWFGKLLVSVKRPDGTLLEFGYNEHNERSQTRVIRPGKPPEVVTYPPQPLDPGQVTYDELGRLTTHTDEQGHRVRLTYDNDGSRSTWRGDRLLRVHKLDGTLIEFAYGPSGDRGETRITKSRQPPEVVKYPPQPADESRGKTHDHLGRWARETVDGQAVRYTYDADGSRNTWVAGRLVQVLKLDGTFIEHAYSTDGFRGRTRTTRPGQPPEVTEHPRPARAKAIAAGAEATTTKPPPPVPPKVMEEKPMEGERERAGSAGFALVAAASVPLNLSEEPPGSTIRLVTSRTYDDLDRLETETTTQPDGTGERTVSYTYYANGLRKTLTDPHENVTFYTYDAQKRLKTVTTRFGTANAKTTTFSYYPDSLLKEIEYPNGVLASYGYDLADRLLTLTHAMGGEVISRYEYTYDANGNRLTQTETNGGLTETTTYTYDNLNRLKTVTYPADTAFPGGRTVTYEYDAVGNRKRETTRDPNGNVLADKQADFDDVNRLTALNDLVTRANSTTFGWDANGNQTSKTTNGLTIEYRYDTRDKMVEAVQGELVLGRFQYDADGRRIKKIGAEGVREYVYDYTSLLAEYSDTGLDVAKYDYGADRLLSLTRGAQKRYYLFDALRSVTNITDEAGATQASYHLDAWGSFRFPSELDGTDAAASKNRFAFTGYLWDQETALYYARARLYDPELGRFTSQDSFLGEINDPPSLHRYFYGNANPVRYIDPTGHENEPANPAVSQETLRRWEEYGKEHPVEVAVAAPENDYSHRNDAQVVTEKRDLSSGFTGWLSNKWLDYQARAERAKKSLGSATSGAWHSLFGTRDQNESKEQAIAALEGDPNAQRIAARDVGKSFENETAEIAREGAEQTFETVKTYAETELSAKSIGMAAGVVGGGLRRGVQAVKAEEQALASSRGTGGISRLERPGFVEFEGLEVRGARDLSHVPEGTLRAMEQRGFAATDAQGNRLILHHLEQNPAGPLVEMPAGRHSIGNPRQHPLGNAPGVGLSAEERAAFNQWRVDYWKARAAEELARRGVK